MQRMTAVVISLAIPAGIVLAQASDKPQRSEVEKQAFARIQQQGGLVMDIAQNDPRLEVSRHLYRLRHLAAPQDSSMVTLSMVTGSRGRSPGPV